MKLNARVSRSRHGIFYFRWPIPIAPDFLPRGTVRLSRITRCPKRADERARHLASCGKLLGRKGYPPKMRHDELRALIHSYFKKWLEKLIDDIDASGPRSELEQAPLLTSQMLAEGPSTPESVALSLTD